MDMKMGKECCTPEEAAEILIKAEEIKNDPVQYKAAQEVLSGKMTTIRSIADLKKMRSKGLTMKDLLTEEDKAALQQKIKLDNNLEKAGFKVKDKVKMSEDSDELYESEESDPEEDAVEGEQDD